MDLLLELNQREKTTLVLVTHDSGLAGRAGRRVHLRDGEIEREEGDAL
jgi:putative ABC transport system ATP-binding protein